MFIIYREYGDYMRMERGISCGISVCEYREYGDYMRMEMNSGVVLQALPLLLRNCQQPRRGARGLPRDVCACVCVFVCVFVCVRVCARVRGVCTW